MNKSKFVLFIILLVLVLITIPLVSASVEYGDGWRKICDDSGKCQFSNYHTIQRWDGQYIPYESLDLWGGQWTYYISENATYYDFIRLGEILSLPKSFGSYNFGLNDISFTFTVTPSQLGSISEENGSGVWYIPIPDKAVKTRFIWDDVKPFIYKNSNQSLYLNDSDFWYSKVNDQIRLNYNQNARNFGIASTNITFVFDSWTVGQGGSSWSGNSLRNNTVEDNPLGSIVVGSAYISGLGIPTNIAIYATSGYTPNWTVSSSQISQTTAMSEKSSIYYINGLNLTDMVVLSKVNVLDRESIPNRVGVSARINSTNYSYVGVIRNSSASSLKHLLLAGKDTMSGPNNATLNVMSNTWYDIRLEVQGSQILYFFNDVQILNMTNSNISYGSAGLYCYDSAKCYYKKFRVYPYGQMSGNLTTWYDSLSGNETYQIDVNATTPTNTNYTVWYANNGTGSYSQLGGTLTGNNSLIISGTKYQNTDVQVRLAGNTTATPEIMKVTLFTQSASGGAGDFIPPTPISLVNTTSNFWVNHTWQAGSGNVTNSYNVSQNGTWTNGSANTFKNVTVGTHGWSNISVYAFNNSGTGTLNQTPVSQNTTVPNNVPILNLIGNHVGMEGNNISFTISGTDADNDSLTCSTTLPYDSISSCTYVWVPNYTASGNYSGNITIQDSYGGSDYETVWVNVSNYSGSIVNVTTSKSIVNVSESFFINITVNPQGGNITGMQTNLEFDETMIRVDNVSEGNLFNQNGAVTTFSPGTINNNTGLVQNIWTVITDAGKAVNQSGTFVTISATAISAGQSGLNFTNLSISNVIIANPASQSVPYNATNGSILVNETSINYIPPTPINCISSNGTSWINVSCLLGIGNITNGMNFTNSTIWSNGTSFFWNNTGLAEGTQYTYHIYAFNNSGAGTLNLTYATVINTTQSTPLVNGSPNITQYWNNINGYNQSAMSINVGNSGTFNVTINQTVDNVSWKVEGAEEQNTSSLQFIRAFNTIGTFNVTAQAFNVNGSSNIIYTVVTVTSTGGGGTDWDYAYGWVNWTNGTMINGASVSTSKGTVYSNAAGYYSFGYVFEHGLSYDFNISKNGILDNKTVSFASGDYQIVNGTLQAPIVNGTPNITSYGNDNTSNATLTLTVPKNTNITFNATSNQTLTSCSWTGATQINCTANTYAYKNFTSTGIQTVSIIGSNVNGSTQTITWTITVTGINNITLSGYVQNSLELKLQNARIDLNSNYTFTDINGYYSFNNINENTYIVLVRAIGYENNSVSIEINSDKIHNFTIKERVWGGTMVTPGFEVILSIIVFLILFVSKNTFIRNKRR